MKLGTIFFYPQYVENASVVSAFVIFNDVIDELSEEDVIVLLVVRRYDDKREVVVLDFKKLVDVVKGRVEVEECEWTLGNDKVSSHVLLMRVSEEHVLVINFNTISGTYTMFTISGMTLVDKVINAIKEKSEEVYKVILEYVNR